MRKSKKYIFIFAIFFIFITGNIYSQEDPDTENNRFRAMWVFNIANNVIWPQEDTLSTFKVGVYSSYKGVYNELITLAETQKIKNKKVEIIFFSRFRRIEYTQILYLGYDKNTDIFRVNDKIENKQTLLITDRLDEENNYMVNILPFDKGSKRIEIDKINIEAHDLGVTTKLLYHGGSEDELKDLYKQQKEKLDKQIAQMEQKKEEIANLQEEMEEQKQLLTEQKQMLQQQKQKLDQMKKTLEEQKQALSKNENMIQEQEKLIKQKQAEVQKQIEQMDKKEKILAQKNSEIEEKQDELKGLEDQIEESKTALSTAKDTIETQKGVLLIVAGFLLIIIIFSLFLWRALRKNSKMNKELKAKNAEITKQKERIEHQAILLENTNKELEKLSIVAENAQNGVVIMDPKGNFEWVNAGFTKMYGYTLQLFINERDENIIDASSNPEIEKLVKKCIDQKVPVTYEMESEKRNKEKIWVKTTLTPIINNENKIQKLVAIDTDITETKRAQEEISKRNEKIAAQAEELKKSNIELEKLSVVVRETNNAVLITDKNGYIEWVNPAFEKTFGYSLQEFKEKVSTNIISDTTQKTVKKEIKELYETKKPVDYQLLTHNKNGKEIWIQANVTPILNDNNDIEKLIVVDSDITFIKQAEKEILEKNSELTAQKEKIQLQNTKIQSSIKYAQTIQQSILPLKSITNKYFQSELIFKPKDIVSGDFYWFYAHPQKNIFYAAAVDCTGHGVPGAFMSLIASRILNEILIKNPDIEPNQILEKTDDFIRKALMQDETNNNDGLDIALSKITKHNDNHITVEFAGAKRNLFVFSQNENNILSIKGTRRSIGGIKRTQQTIPFDSEKIVLRKNDIMYLMTDGYIDQNDKYRKRLGSLKVKDIFENIYNKNLKEQKEILLDKLDKQMKDTEQRDDITLWIIKL